MTITDYELTDFSIYINWPNKLSLPPEEFHATFEGEEFNQINRSADEAILGYENESTEVKYNLDQKSVRVTPTSVGELEAATNLISTWLINWEMTDDPIDYTLNGSAILRYDTDIEKNAAELLSDSINTPDMIEDFSMEQANAITWRYSNTSYSDADTHVDIKVEPYVENPEYFFISIMKECTNRTDVWDTASNIEDVLNALIERAIN